MTTDKETLLAYADSLEWQPIETAPKDGTPVMVRGEADGPCVSGHIEAIASNNFDEEWCEDDSWTLDNDSYGTKIHPTHWMPLPTGNAAAVIRELVIELSAIYERERVNPWLAANEAMKEAAKKIACDDSQSHTNQSDYQSKRAKGE